MPALRSGEFVTAKCEQYTVSLNQAVYQCADDIYVMHSCQTIHFFHALREDPVGNIFGRFQGSDASAGSVLTGSHCDAIPLAGESGVQIRTSGESGPELTHQAVPLNRHVRRDSRSHRCD